MNAVACSPASGDPFWRHTIVSWQLTYLLPCLQDIWVPNRNRSTSKRDEQISLINSFAFSFWANTFDFHTVLCSRMVVLYSPRQCQPTQSPLQRQTRSPTHKIFSFLQFPSVRFQHKTRYESISSDCIVYLYAVDRRDVNREQSISKQWPIKCAVALLASIGNCLSMWRE